MRHLYPIIFQIQYIISREDSEKSTKRKKGNISAGARRRVDLFTPNVRRKVAPGMPSFEV
jgi:hypothetical protein